MPLKVTCPSCHSVFSVKDEYAGKTGFCRECGTRMKIEGAKPPVVQFITTSTELDDFPGLFKRGWATVVYVFGAIGNFMSYIVNKAEDAYSFTLKIANWIADVCFPRRGKKDDKTAQKVVAIVALFLACIFAFVVHDKLEEISTAHKLRKREAAKQMQQEESRLLYIMKNGDGHDYLSLSAQDRSKICKIIEEAISESGVTQRDFHRFIYDFYSTARRHGKNDPNLSRSISDVAVEYAVMSSR